MSDGDFLLIVSSVIILTVMVFWSHFESEAARIRRQNEKR